MAEEVDPATLSDAEQELPAGDLANEAAEEHSGAHIDDALADASDEVVSRARALDDAEAGRIAARQRSTVVVLAGEVGSGKTTLLAALYERFCRGSVAGRDFAGSVTLPGFEARCWGLRAGSERSVPTMPHTHREALPWLHLRVASDLDRHELLLGDFDGEIFQDIIDGKELASAVPALRRADHLAIVLDGALLADPQRRQATRQRANDLLTVLGSQQDAIADARVITLVVTKQDAIYRAADREKDEVQSAIDELRSATTRAFDGYVPAVISTAAISRIEDLPLGHGLDELLDLWSRNPFVSIRPERSGPIDSSLNDWLARFEA